MSRQIINGYHCVDARELNTIHRNDFIDAAITSPPYGSQKDYGSCKANRSQAVV